MCIFNIGMLSRVNVAATRIFVGPTQDGRQLCIYENTVQLPKPKHASGTTTSTSTGTAMILPFPHTSSSQKLKFVDLSQGTERARCLIDFDLAWPTSVPFRETRQLQAFAKSKPEKKLEVVKVGNYDCSVAENLADVRRVDDGVFKLSENVDKILEKHYGEGYGFVICQLKAGGRQHPIGYVHDIVKPGELFVPTRHQHGNEREEANADWDHKIYSLNTDAKSAGRTPAEEKAHIKSSMKDHAVVEATVTIDEKYLERLVVPLAPMHCIRRLTIHGKDVNRDVVFKLASK